MLLLKKKKYAAVTLEKKPNGEIFCNTELKGAMKDVGHIREHERTDASVPISSKPQFCLVAFPAFGPKISSAHAY